MSKSRVTHGHFKDGTPITPATVDTLVEQAEQGFDPGAMRPRRIGRPPLGDEPSAKLQLRLEPALMRRVQAEAARQGRTVSVVVRDLIAKGLGNSELELQEIQTPNGVVKRYSRAGETAHPADPAAEPTTSVPIVLPSWLHGTAPSEASAGGLLRPSDPAAAGCHPVLFQRMLTTKQTRGARIVVIDRRRTDTAGEADLFLGLKPGTDTALFAGMLAHLADNGALDRGYIERHTGGFEEVYGLVNEPAAGLLATIRREPGLWAQWDYGDGPRVAGRSTVRFYRKHPDLAVMANLGMTPVSLGVHSALSNMP